MKKWSIFLLGVSVLIGIGVFYNRSQEKWDKRIYLASFPRSGNHWVRFLIEEATHVATSSVYRDPDPWHLKTKFPWGGYCIDHGYAGDCRYPTPDDHVIIKTHFPYFGPAPFDLKPSLKTIRVVRHPVDSFFSWYYAKGGFHHLTRDELKEEISAWRRFEEHWNTQPDVLTVRYEDLFENPHDVLKTIIEAIGYKVSEEDLHRAIKMHPPRGSILKHFSQYRQEDLELIKTELGDLMQRYGYEIP